MGKTVALDGPALAWARSEFSRYYAAAPIDAPPRLARREFASFPFATETLMRRHASFRSPEEFHRFLSREAPRHVYYSSAYYREPDHAQMAAKGWMGADLIFDLDADHLRGAAELDYPGQLALVKDRVRDLLDDFLVGDFGISPESTRLVFSGGRGYHVHVRDEAFLPLTSPERRELVEYVMGVGFDPASAVVEVREDAANPMAIVGVDGSAEAAPARRRGRDPTYRRLVPPETPGWPGRTTRAVQQLLARWEEAGADGAASEMEGLGLPPRSARTLARSLIGEGRSRRIRSTLSLEVFPREVPKEFLATVLRQAAIEVQGETDAPVTTDIHRLIRLPNSLHGGTGLRVVPLDRGGLDAFDPLRDAVVSSPGATTVILAEDMDLEFNGARVVGAAGDPRDLPSATALFLILRGQAALRPGPAP
jgi:DNA primase small subunit